MSVFHEGSLHTIGSPGSLWLSGGGGALDSGLSIALLLWVHSVSYSDEDERDSVLIIRSPSLRYVRHPAGS